MTKQGRRGEPRAGKVEKSGSESIPEPAPGPVDPREVPRQDGRPGEAAGEGGRGLKERRGGKLQP